MSSPFQPPDDPHQPQYGQQPPQLYGPPLQYGQQPPPQYGQQPPPQYGQQPPQYAAQQPPPYGQQPPPYGQQPPPYGQQPPQFGPPPMLVPEPKKKTGQKLKFGLIGGGVFLLLVCVGAAFAGGNSDKPEANNTIGVIATTQATSKPAAAAPTATKKAAKPTTAAPAEPVDEPEPEKKLTVSQENAVDKAADYLSYTAFSRSGLIKQLKFEGFSTKDATVGVDAQKADWNDQAAKKAQDYLDTSSFSRSGLIRQLKFEGFTTAQATYGAKKVGL
ncbi:Ltp family lipoprotein [Paractinoplanes hotanensis]|uniref:Ltp family lipoprotein n=1 Tax=Paractinoplanes hotanensis TaxID=2906497 RepID=A0ABT0YAR7_9ACTN|nr:Ltp family lipoprotein [Actinoplanes hotanensis]MCM4083137.1 Ltp family lipoprotein [Actinoplanes hotanensis]